MYLSLKGTESLHKTPVNVEMFEMAVVLHAAYSFPRGEGTCLLPLMSSVELRVQKAVTF